tara:strand:- start:215 stop:337 length:123 start_codon:yes stop_codon:yes gene_type:complete
MWSAKIRVVFLNWQICFVTFYDVTLLVKTFGNKATPESVI